jgi:(2Fe-2S) ferredoxin
MKDRTADHRERLDAHVLVCTNDREEHDCCADAGGEQTLAAVKDWLRERDAFWSSISVTETGCLGLCSADGAAISIQPRNRWYSDVQPEDVPAVLESAFGPDADRVAVAADRSVDSDRSVDDDHEQSADD